MDALTQETKKEYKKPHLVTMGNIVELTQDVNVIGSGDSIFTLLES